MKKEKEKQTGRQTDEQTDGRADRRTDDRQTDRQTETEIEERRQTERQRDRYKQKKTYRHNDSEREKQRTDHQFFFWLSYIISQPRTQLMKFTFRLLVKVPLLPVCEKNLSSDSPNVLAGGKVRFSVKWLLFVLSLLRLVYHYTYQGEKKRGGGGRD